MEANVVGVVSGMGAFYSNMKLREKPEMRETQI